MMSKPFWFSIILLLFAAACAPSQPAADLPQETESIAAIAIEAESTEAATATTEAPPNLAIVPETLSQLSLLWNANFPGDVDNYSSCISIEQECPLATNISDYAFSPDGSTLALGICLGLRTEDRTDGDIDAWGCTGETAIVLYDSAMGDERGRLATAALPLALAFHPDGAILAAGLANSDIELWDLSNAELSATLTGDRRKTGYNRLAFVLDGSMLIANSGGVIGLELWDWRSADLLAMIERGFGFGVSPDGGSLATLNFGESFGDDADAIRVYDLTDLDSFSEFPIDLDQPIPTIFHFSPDGGMIAGRPAGFGAFHVNFWDIASTDLVASWDYDREFDQTGMDLELNSPGFTPEGYFLVTRFGELNTPEAQPEATGLEAALWQCGFALADVAADQIFYHSLPMPIEECEGPEYLYLLFGLGGSPQILSPDGRFIAAEDGWGSLRVWGINASLPAVPPECSGDC